MAKITAFKTEITAKVVIELTEVEARALDAMAGYGHEPFLEGFYNNLGKSYMQPHEKGVISLFEMIRNELPTYLKKIDAVKKAIIL